MAEYELLSGLHIAPSPAGAYYAASSPLDDPARATLIRLLGYTESPPFTVDALRELTGLNDEQAALEHIYRLQDLGRVPSGTSLDAPVSLRAWPGLTRLQLTPGAMQIAALWVKQPTGLMATAERLGLPYRYVFSFFTACQALDLVDQAAITPARAAPSASAAQAVPAERRGLFRRMLNKLGLG
ncbi:MAG: hypothetical protein AB7U65_01840 [Halothiobacillaceae bacterium]